MLKANINIAATMAPLATIISGGFIGVMSPYDTIVNVENDQYMERKYY